MKMKISYNDREGGSMLLGDRYCGIHLICVPVLIGKLVWIVDNTDNKRARRATSNVFSISQVVLFVV